MHSPKQKIGISQANFVRTRISRWRQDSQLQIVKENQRVCETLLTFHHLHKKIPVKERVMIVKHLMATKFFVNSNTQSCLSLSSVMNGRHASEQNGQLAREVDSLQRVSLILALSLTQVAADPTRAAEFGKEIQELKKVVIDVRQSSRDQLVNFFQNSFVRWLKMLKHQVSTEPQFSASKAQLVDVVKVAGSGHEPHNDILHLAEMTALIENAISSYDEKDEVFQHFATVSEEWICSELSFHLEGVKGTDNVDRHQDCLKQCHQIQERMLQIPQCLEDFWKRIEQAEGRDLFLQAYDDILREPNSDPERFAKLLCSLSGRPGDQKHATQLTEFLTKERRGLSSCYLEFVIKGIAEIQDKIPTGDVQNTHFVFYASSITAISRSIDNCPPAFNKYDSTLSELTGQEDCSLLLQLLVGSVHLLSLPVRGEAHTALEETLKALAKIFTFYPQHRAFIAEEIDHWSQRNLPPNQVGSLVDRIANLHDVIGPEVTTAALHLSQAMLEPTLFLHNYQNKAEIASAFPFSAVYTLYPRLCNSVAATADCSLDIVTDQRLELLRMTETLLSKFLTSPSKANLFPFVHNVDLGLEGLTQILNMCNFEAMFQEIFEFVVVSQSFMKNHTYQRGQQKSAQFRKDTSNLVINKVLFKAMAKNEKSQHAKRTFAKDFHKVSRVLAQAVRCLTTALRVGISTFKSQNFGSRGDKNFKLAFAQRLELPNRLIKLVIDPSSGYHVGVAQYSGKSFNLFTALTVCLNYESEFLPRAPETGSLSSNILEFFATASELWHLSALRDDKSVTQLHNVVQSLELQNFQTHWRYMGNTGALFRHCFKMGVDNRAFDDLTAFFQLLSACCSPSKAGSQKEFVQLVLSDSEFQNSFFKLLLQTDKQSQGQTEQKRIKLLNALTVFLGDLAQAGVNDNLIKELFQSHLSRIHGEKVRDFVIDRMRLCSQLSGQQGDLARLLKSIKSDLSLGLNESVANEEIFLQFKEYVAAQRAITSFLNLLTTALKLESDNEKVKEMMGQVVGKCDEIVTIEYQLQLEGDLSAAVAEVCMNQDLVRHSDVQMYIDKCVEFADGNIVADSSHQGPADSVYITRFDHRYALEKISREMEWSGMDQWVRLSSFKRHGDYGSNFVIDLDEYIGLLDTHCYDLKSPEVQQLREHSLKWNWSNSLLSSQAFFTKALKEAVLLIVQASISRSAMDFAKDIRSNNQKANNVNQILPQALQVLKGTTTCQHALKMCEKLQVSIQQLHGQCGDSVHSLLSCQLDLCACLLTLVSVSVRDESLQQNQLAKVQDELKKFLTGFLDHMQGLFSQAVQIMLYARESKTEGGRNTYSEHQIAMNRASVVKFVDLVDKAFSLGKFCGEEGVMQLDETKILVILKSIIQIMELYPGDALEPGLSAVENAVCLFSHAGPLLQLLNTGNALTYLTDILTKPNVSVDCTSAIVKALLAIVQQSEECAGVLIEAGLVGRICQNANIVSASASDKYYESDLNGRGLIEDRRRTNTSSLWLWTLQLISELNDTVNGEDLNYEKQLQLFLVTHQERIFTVLGVGHRISAAQSSGDPALEQRVKQHLSLAFYEELELTTLALVRVFQHAHKYLLAGPSLRRLFQQLQALLCGSVPALLLLERPGQLQLVPQSHAEHKLRQLLLHRHQDALADADNPSGLDLKLTDCELKVYANLLRCLQCLFLDPRNNQRAALAGAGETTPFIGLFTLLDALHEKFVCVQAAFMQAEQQAFSCLWGEVQASYRQMSYLQDQRQSLNSAMAALSFEELTRLLGSAGLLGWAVLAEVGLCALGEVPAEGLQAQKETLRAQFRDKTDVLKNVALKKDHAVFIEKLMERYEKKLAEQDPFYNVMNSTYAN